MAAVAAAAGVRRGGGVAAATAKPGRASPDFDLDQPLDSRDRGLVRALKREFNDMLMKMVAEVRHAHEQQETFILRHLESAARRSSRSIDAADLDLDHVDEAPELLVPAGTNQAPRDVSAQPGQDQQSISHSLGNRHGSHEALILMEGVTHSSPQALESEEPDTDEEVEQGDDVQASDPYGDPQYSLRRQPHGAFQEFNTPQPTSNLDQVEYTVEMYYFNEGYGQQIARSTAFINTTLAVITANAIYIGVDVDNNDAVSPLDADVGFVIMDNLFCLYFSLEILVRFLAFEVKFNCLRDGWFKFDLALVTLMVAETWVSPLVLLSTGASFEGVPTAPLRLLRLLRLSRLVRLMRSMPELITMVKGICVAARAVASSLLMILLLVYVFGIVLFMMLKEEGSDIVVTKFFSLPRCMWTLLLDGTLLDSTGFVLTELLDSRSVNSSLALLIFMIFILLSANTVMNMLIGVLCEVVSAVGQDERDSADVKQLKKSILLELKAFDDDGNALISDSELQHVMNNPHARSVLANLGIDVEYLKDLQEMLFEGVDEVSIESIMDMMLMCRGDLPVEVKHVVCGQAFNRWSIKRELAHFESRLQAAVRNVETHVRHLPSRSHPPSPSHSAGQKAPAAPRTTSMPAPAPTLVAKHASAVGPSREPTEISAI